MKKKGSELNNGISLDETGVTETVFDNSRYLVPTPFIYSVSGIRLGEFDLGGVLYHTNYFHLYEAARESLLEQIGCPYPGLVEQKAHLAVIESGQRFLRPIRYGEPVAIALSISELKRTTFRVTYRIHKGAELIHEAFTKHVFVQVTDGEFRPKALPENLRKGLELYLEREPE